MTRRLFTAAALALPVRAAETRQVRGRRLLDQSVAALGGDSFLRMRDRKEVGRAYTFYREELTGLSVAHIYTRYIDRPEPGKLGLVERQAYGKKQDSAVLFLDGQGFDVTFRGARPLPDALLERYYLTTKNNYLYIVRQRLNEPNMVFEHTGSEVIENQAVEVLDIFDEENNNVTVYLSSTTKLPVRQRFYRRDPLNRDRIEEVTRFSKFKASPKGAMWPLNLQRERDTEKLTEIYDDSVEIDAGISEDLFKLPNDIQLLRKEKS
ncbi:MAG: hypothetical protein M3Z36_02610 [Acidobacteriota bacterium]|nr:hypothetical protein [Acidobacteriota bacterium]